MHQDNLKNGKYNEPADHIQMHLGNMAPDELIDEMAEKWASMDDKSFDTRVIDEYLSALDESGLMQINFDAEASLSKFHEKHHTLLNEISTMSMPAEKFKPKIGRRRRAARLIAATVIVMLGCMITANALGFNILGSLVRWTEETFQIIFLPGAQNGISDASLDGEYASLQEALTAYRITEKVLPSRYPSGFEMSSLNITTTTDSIQFRAAFKNGNKFFKITIYQFNTDDNVYSRYFEKDNSDVILYEYAGIKHYIMSNIEQRRATWMNNNIMCTISGDLTEDELKEMIELVYESER